MSQNATNASGERVINPKFLQQFLEKPSSPKRVVNPKFLQLLLENKSPPPSSKRRVVFNDDVAIVLYVPDESPSALFDVIPIN
jgi:hypothetical protein